MLELRQRYLTDRRPAWLRRAGDLLILSLSFPVVFSSPLFVNGATMLANQVSFHTVLKGHRSGVLESVQIVARNQRDWSALWKRHAAIESNPPPLPTMDFGKEIVAAVFLGEKPTGGHDIEITSVERSANNLVVSFVERGPQPGGVVTQAFTQPFHIVKVAAQGSGTVSFRRLP
jgi:hypothetical protein